MILYRLASRRYAAANNGEGARLYGGRWNHPGTAAIYTSGTRSLAALEIIVHNGAIPSDYRVVVADVPDHRECRTRETARRLAKRELALRDSGTWNGMGTLTANSSSSRTIGGHPGGV